MIIPTRDNQAWVRALGAGGDAQAAAVMELRRILLGGLARSFEGRERVNEAFFEDIVQEATVKILANLSSFEGRSRFTTWAMAIAVRLAISELRQKRWQDVSLEDSAKNGELRPELAVDSTATPERQSEQRAILESLRNLIEAELTERQRTALQAELAGVPMEEIARRSGSNLNAIYKLLHDARKCLKRGLEQAGYRVNDIQAAFL
jgi:RNA polymerase sigma-70 factor (ECF subfamily)